MPTLSEKIETICLKEYSKVSLADLEELECYFYSENIQEIKTLEPIRKISSVFTQLKDKTNYGGTLDNKKYEEVLDILKAEFVFLINKTEESFFIKNIESFFSLLNSSNQPLFEVIISKVNNIELDLPKKTVFNILYQSLKNDNNFKLLYQSKFFKEFSNNTNLDLISLCVSSDGDSNVFKFLLNELHVKTKNPLKPGCLINILNSNNTIQTLEYLEMLNILENSLTDSFLTQFHQHINNKNKQLISQNINIANFIYSKASYETLEKVKDSLPNEFKEVFEKHLLDKKFTKTPYQYKLQI